MSKLQRTLAGLILAGFVAGCGGSSAPPLSEDEKRPDAGVSAAEKLKYTMQGPNSKTKKKAR